MITTTAKERYANYLTTPGWAATKQRRLAIALTDGRDCIVCDSCRMLVWKVAIDVHHWTYERQGQEQMSDLSVLCMGCHALMHGRPVPDWYLRRMQDGSVQKWEQDDLERALKELYATGEYSLKDPRLLQMALVLVAPRVTRDEVLDGVDLRTRNRFNDFSRYVERRFGTT